MELVLCKLTLEALDAELAFRLEHIFPSARVVIARCIGCCGDCADRYVALCDGRSVTASDFAGLVHGIKGLAHEYSKEVANYEQLFDA